MTMAKEARYDLRGDEEQKHIIKPAAKLSRRNLSEFMIEAAYSEAQNILADRREFPLDDEQWDAFYAALDRPPKSIPKLRKLFNEPSVFER